LAPLLGTLRTDRTLRQGPDWTHPPESGRPDARHVSPSSNTARRSRTIKLLPRATSRPDPDSRVRLQHRLSPVSNREKTESARAIGLTPGQATGPAGQQSSLVSKSHREVLGASDRVRRTLTGLSARVRCTTHRHIALVHTTAITGPSCLGPVVPNT
jgi:hypothetical protein